MRKSRSCWLFKQVEHAGLITVGFHTVSYMICIKFLKKVNRNDNFSSTIIFTPR
jgi:hypothetical protein